MAAFRVRSAAFAVLLLAAFGLGGFAVDSHGPDLVAAGPDHADLPAFEAGHSRPDPTLHVESATPIAASACVACLIRHVPRARVTLPIAFGVGQSGGSAAILGPDRAPESGVRRLPGSRAPPRA